MSSVRNVLVADGRSHAELKTGMETLVKIHGELHGTFYSKKGVLWKFSIGRKRAVGNGEIDAF